LAPKFQVKHDLNQTWYTAYYDETKYKVSYELEFGGQTIKAGDKIKIKHQRGDFKFRCFVYCPETDSAWFDAIAVPGGSWHSFGLSKLKGVIKPKKRSYRKRVVKK